MDTKREQDRIDDETLGDVPAWKGVVDLQEGTRIHRYLILALIGKGGMGAVYKAYDPELDRRFAIKVMRVVLDEGETTSKPQARLMREAQALAKLNHPNVVSVFDVGAFDDGVYIAMEYVEGKTLRDWLKQDKPTQAEILDVMLAAGNGLQSAHAQGIVHRDFKPENLIVGHVGQVKVLDFGLARAADFDDAPIANRQAPSQFESESNSNTLNQPLTQFGALIGTTAYMAPEHFLNQEKDTLSSRSFGWRDRRRSTGRKSHNSHCLAGRL